MSAPSNKISSFEGKKLWRTDRTDRPPGKFIGMDNLIDGETGMQFTCKEDFHNHLSVKSVQVHVRLFPASPVAAYQNMKDRDSPSYWDLVSMGVQYKFQRSRNLFPREAFDRNRIEFDNMTIMQTGKQIGRAHV
jgi:hypothetical protein